MKTTVLSAFLIVASSVMLSLQAQEPENEKKHVKIEITIDENGETESIIREFDLEDVDKYLNLVSDIQSVEATTTEDGEMRVFIRREGDKAQTYTYNFGDVTCKESTGKSSAFLGVVGTTREHKGTKAVVIDKVISGTAAEKAGLKKEDIILEADGKTINNYTEFVRAIGAKQAGDNLILLVEREGLKKELTVTLGEQMDGMKNRHIYVFKSVKEGEGNKEVNIKVDVNIGNISDEEKKMVRNSLGVESSSGIKEYDLDIYPNPVKDKLNFELELQEGGVLEVILMDNSGKILRKESLSDTGGSYEGELSLDHYPQGHYFLVFRKGDACIIEKVVK